MSQRQQKLAAYASWISAEPAADDEAFVEIVSKSFVPELTNKPLHLDRGAQY